MYFLDPKISTVFLLLVESWPCPETFSPAGFFNYIFFFTVYNTAGGVRVTTGRSSGLKISLSTTLGGSLKSPIRPN